MILAWLGWRRCRARELIALAQRRGTQISTLSRQLAEVLETNERCQWSVRTGPAIGKRLAARLADVEHLLPRDFGNSSMSPSKDDDPSRTPGADREPGLGWAARDPAAIGDGHPVRSTPGAPRLRRACQLFCARSSEALPMAPWSRSKVLWVYRAHSAGQRGRPGQYSVAFGGSPPESTVAETCTIDERGGCRPR